MQPTADEFWTEEQILQAAREDWAQVLISMWDAIGKPVDERRLAEYVRALSGIPRGLLQKAVDLAVRDNGSYQTVPTIGAIWQALRKVLGNPNDLDAAMELWCEASFSRCFVRFEVPENGVVYDK